MSAVGPRTDLCAPTFEVKDEKVDAQYDKGILTIHIPKPADLQKPVRRIEVKAS